VVLASSTSGGQHFYEIVALFKTLPNQDSRTAGSRFAHDDKEPDPSWGKLLTEEQSRETAEM
jgi:hypothetical protein